MKVYRDLIADIIQYPDKAKTRELIQNNFGEFNDIDFKESIGEYDKLSKHILAIANTGGGLIIIGVKQDNTTGTNIPVGIAEFIDKAEISKGVYKYVPKYLEFDILDFDYKETEYEDLKGKLIQVIIINHSPKYIPFISLKSGKNIVEHKIYIRRGTESVEPSYEELQILLSKRIETEFSNASIIGLDEHLMHLKILYNQLKPELTINNLANIFSVPLGHTKVKNEKFPDESYEDFILELIEKKKEIIRRMVTRD